MEKFVSSPLAPLCAIAIILVLAFARITAAKTVEISKPTQVSIVHRECRKATRLNPGWEYAILVLPESEYRRLTEPLIVI